MAQGSRRRAPLEDTKSTLYCSFCGKSQHEVHKLVAGPTVFICDECIELCDDIVWIETGSRLAVKIRVPPSSSYDDVFYDVLAKIVAETYPDVDFRYEFKTPAKWKERDSHNLVAFSIVKAEGDDQRSYAALQAQVTRVVEKLAVMTAKFVHESEKAKALTQQITELKAEAYDFLRANYQSSRSPHKDLRAVMFLDISGFSKFSFENKQSVVDLLRGITPTLLEERGAHEINMWGDAIVANFTDANQAISSAVKFIRHLAVEQLDARIGMAWGEIRTNYNEAIGRRDIDGPVVDFAARLEPLAPLGGILLSKDFVGLDVNGTLGELVPVTREVQKPFGKFEKGDILELYEFRMTRN